MFKRHYYFSDDDIIDVVLGVVAGNHFDNDPLWLYLISPPSGGKTELLMSLQMCPETYFLSDFTAASLISGYKDPEGKKSSSKGETKNESESELSEGAEQVAMHFGDEPSDDVEPEEQKPATPGDDDYSLLPLLNGKVLITKDFSIIHDKPAETRSQVLAILRDVYDGYASRKVGNSHTKGYHSRFNYLAGMTPDIEKSWSLNTLGERFLMYRIKIDNRREHAKRALLNARAETTGSLAIREELQRAVKEFMEGVERTRPDVDDDMVERILDLSEILATCRTYVHRDKKDEIHCLPQAELASRVSKQLLRVGQSVALVRGKSRVGEAEFSVMKRIALDSLPTNRRLLLAALWECWDPKRNPETGKTTVTMNPLKTFSANVTRISETSVRRELDNLAEVGAVKRNKGQVAGESDKKKKDGSPKLVKTTQTTYRLTDEFARYCKNVGGIPSS
jgi:hypothetical protein